MRNQWKPEDKLRKGKHKKQGNVSREDRVMQTKVANADLELLEKQFTRRAKKLEKKRSKSIK